MPFQEHKAGCQAELQHKIVLSVVCKGVTNPIREPLAKDCLCTFDGSQSARLAATLHANRSISDQVLGTRNAGLTRAGEPSPAAKYISQQDALSIFSRRLALS